MSRINCASLQEDAKKLIRGLITRRDLDAPFASVVVDASGPMRSRVSVFDLPHSRINGRFSFHRNTSSPGTDALFPGELARLLPIITPRADSRFAVFSEGGDPTLEVTAAREYHPSDNVVATSSRPCPRKAMTNVRVKP